MRRRIIVVNVATTTPWRHDVNIQRGNPLGNPLIMKGEGGRDDAVAGFKMLLCEPCSPAEVAARIRARGGASLPIHAAQADRFGFRERSEAITQLARRVGMGEKVRLVCACAPKACHGDAIKAAVLSEVARL